MFRPSVRADNGGIAAGRDVNIGPSETDIRRIVAETLAQESSKDKQIEELSWTLEIHKEAIASFFRTVEEKDIPAERRVDVLAEIAQRHLRLIEEVRVLRADDPAVRQRRDEALTALELGDDAKAEAALVAARGLVRQKRERLMQALSEHAIEEAQIEGALGDLAMKHLAYPCAAEHYASAAKLLPAGYDRERLSYLDREAAACYRQGVEFGDNAALETAIVRYRALLDECPRDRMPLDWARTQVNLGLALWRLGEREAGPERLEEAVQTYRAALREYTRDRVPLDWARTQMNLGLALGTLGERERSPKRLEEAVEAFREALKEQTRDRVPLDWARTQNNLGTALGALGEREAGTARLEEAVEAFREALKEHTRERVPLAWAMTQNNLGNALAALGERADDPWWLEAAVDAYREALQERTQERLPLEWAGTQHNLGHALINLGNFKNDPEQLKEAVKAFREALKERTRERVPLDWAKTQMLLGNSSFFLAVRSLDRDQLVVAKEALNASQVVFRDAGFRHYDDTCAQLIQIIDKVLAGIPTTSAVPNR